MDRRKIFSASRKDFRIDYFRCPGNGGQNVNKVESGVRITHLATGLSAMSCKTRDQPKNKKDAWQKLTKLLLAHVLKEEHVNGVAKAHEQGTVRTYHEPDNRVTDRRTGIQQRYQRTLDGDIGAFLEAAADPSRPGREG